MTRKIIFSGVFLVSWFVPGAWVIPGIFYFFNKGNGMEIIDLARQHLSLSRKLWWARTCEYYSAVHALESALAEIEEQALQIEEEN